MQNLGQKLSNAYYDSVKPVLQEHYENARIGEYTAWSLCAAVMIKPNRSVRRIRLKQDDAKGEVVVCISEKPLRDRIRLKHDERGSSCAYQ